MLECSEIATILIHECIGIYLNLRPLFSIPRLINDHGMKVILMNDKLSGTHGEHEGEYK